MKHASLIVASALVLGVPTVVAAQEYSGQQGQQTQQRLSSDAHHVIDRKAVNAQGKDIGKIKDVVVGQDGKVQALIVDVKGKNRAVPWGEVAMKADQLTVNMNDQQLSQLPEYKAGAD